MTTKNISVTVDGRVLQVTEGCSIAAALLQSGYMRFRASVDGTPRAPLCGMGICFECRVTVDELAHVRSCMVVCRDGMTIRTDEQHA